MRALLDAEVSVPLDGWVREQLVAETGGNPLALLEWPRALTTQQWAAADPLGDAGLVWRAAEWLAEGDFDLMAADLLELVTVMRCEAQNDYEGVRHG